MPAGFENSEKYRNYISKRRAHWQQNARQFEKQNIFNSAYHRRLKEVYGYLIPQGMRVLEIGCGNGDLLASLQPAFGIGLDISHEMLLQAKGKHPSLYFIEGDAQLLPIHAPFDYIILSDLVNDLWDVQSLFTDIQKLCSPSTRVIINTYSRLWQPMLAMADGLHLAKSNLLQNWLTLPDLKNLLELSDYEQIHTWQEMLLPLSIPLVYPFINKFLAKLWPFNIFCLSNFLVAKSRICAENSPAPSVTVVVPARNEAGNVPDIFKRVPEMGSKTELIFVEGNSSDNTYEEIEKHLSMNLRPNCMLLKQPGKGKGDAVRTGFAAATCDILMILDADLTVPPEDLPRFYDAMAAGKGEFINGVRLVYPMEDKAMQLFNFLGNKFFSIAFSWLLGQSVKDTLCGTKVLWKKDYDRIVANRLYFGNFDPFGDFDLLLGAAKLNLKIVDLPIRYRERIYGTTNIQRWKHGWLLLKMVLFSARKMKFV
jgi:ubiquinone/menaquinone biosynthesis C-methylase UbiE